MILNHFYFEKSRNQEVDAIRPPRVFETALSHPILVGPRDK